MLIVNTSVRLCIQNQFLVYQKVLYVWPEVDTSFFEL